MSVFEKGGQLAFEVKDNGIGIAEEKIKKLFTPFTQVENIFTRAHAGSGLGLSLVKHLIELHGGHVEMKSVEGKGTTVTVYFPKERIVQDQIEKVIPPVKAVEKVTPKKVAKPKKIVAKKTTKKKVKKVAVGTRKKGEK